MNRIKPEDPKGIKIRLKQLRLEMGWSKTEAANKIGVPVSTYANWEAMDSYYRGYGSNYGY